MKKRMFGKRAFQPIKALTAILLSQAECTFKESAEFFTFETF